MVNVEIIFTFNVHAFFLHFPLFTWLNQVNPDPYVECDPEVDINNNIITIIS